MKDIPKFLYRYCPLRAENIKDLEYLRNVLERNELYFSRLKDFNDPFDCSPVYQAPPADFPFWKESIKKNKEYAENYDLSKLDKNVNTEIFIEAVQKGIAEHINSACGICCFSSNPHNLLMWAHYASLHTGVCLQFDTATGMDFFEAATNVDYNVTRPVVNIFTYKKGLSVDMFYTKSHEWLYEDEYRIVDTNRIPGKTYPFPPNSLTGIIFGAKTKETNEKELLEVVHKRIDNPIEKFKAKLNDLEYKIDIEPFHNY